MLDRRGREKKCVNPYRITNVSYSKMENKSAPNIDEKNTGDEVLLTIQRCTAAKWAKWLTGITLMWAVLVCGCHGSDGSKVISADEPQRIVYYHWLGVSPGAGYTHTSLCAFEIDLVQGRGRRILTGRHGGKTDRILSCS